MAEEITVRQYLKLLFDFLSRLSGQSYEQLGRDYNRYLQDRKLATPEAKAVLDRLVKITEIPDKLAVLLELNIKELEELGLLDLVVTAEILGLPVSQIAIPAEKKRKAKSLPTKNRKMGSESLQVIRAIIFAPGQSTEAIEKAAFATKQDKKSKAKIANVRYYLLGKITKAAVDMARELNELPMADVIGSWLPVVSTQQTQLYQKMIDDFGNKNASFFIRDYLSFRHESVLVSTAQPGVVLDSVVETVLGHKFCQAGSGDFLVPIVGEDIGGFLRRKGIGKGRSWKDTLMASFNRAQRVNGESVSEKDCLRAQENIIAALKNGGTVFTADAKDLNTRFFLAILKEAGLDQKKRLADFIFPTGNVNVDLCSRMVLTPSELSEGTVRK